MKQKIVYLKQRLTSRFAALRWPLTSLIERVAATRSDGIISSRAATKRFPIRGLRYWWLRCAMLEEIKDREGEIVIADVGCSRGHLKRFIGGIPDTRWVGLDWRIDDEALRECGYSELHECDFDAPLPLADGSVDIVVFSHVVEHLLRPDFTVKELSRVLKPGGLLISGSPVAPFPVAGFRQWQLRSRLRRGKIKPGGHINSMSPGRWKQLLHTQGLNLQQMTGTFLVRWSGNPMENQEWWVRLNQLWGALFPSLGGEIYLTARKPVLPVPQRKTAAAEAIKKKAFMPRWAWSAGAIFVCVGAWGMHSWSCPVHRLVERHQDGNDRFYLLNHSALDDVKPHAAIKMIQQDLDIEAEYNHQSDKEMDMHFLVQIDVDDEVIASLNKLRYRITDEIEIEGHRFVLMSNESDDRDRE